jgi:conjugative relaxase-like TrwC/TraI family protein
MFTAVPQKNQATARLYFTEHLSRNDYYSQGEVAPGQWIGAGSQRLGMKEGATVSQDAFTALCDNIHPTTGKLITQRRHVDRRVFFDFTCSAPKSVSILAVMLDDQRIIEAHQAAARFAIKELEQFAGGRIRQGGSSEDRTTGNLVGAEFTHTSSRALDPQLHTHFTLFNATFDPHEQRWKALQTSAMFRAIGFATEVYRNDLAHRLHGLGYETVKTADAFEIKGVSPTLCQRFSKRAQQRDAAVKAVEQKLGRKLSHNEVAHAVHQTRARKVSGISTAEVRRYQLDQLSPAELRSLQALRRSADGERRGFTTQVEEDAALRLAADHLFERHSVVTQEQLLQHALIEGRGQLDLATLKQVMAGEAEFVRVERELSLRSILAAELALVRTVDSGKDSLAAIYPGFVSSPQLGPDQRDALQHLLCSPDRFTGLRGLAGTGKSTTLRELDRACRLAGCEPLFCAPTGSAAEVLRKDDLPAITLQHLLVDPEQQSRIANGVVVLDEAGAVGLADLQRLFDLAAEHNARVILSGDTGQHAPVAQGDALRLLEAHSRYSFAELSRIRRQQHDDYRQAVELAARQQPEEAFAWLDALGAISEHPSGDSSSTLQHEAAAAYAESVRDGRSALLVAPTWNEIEALTDHVREQLKARGLITGGEVTRRVHDSLSWTEAQRRNLANYQPGHVLVFHQRSGSFAKHEAVTVIETGRTLRVRRADGSIATMRPGGRTARSAFDVCEQRTLAIAPGERLLLQGNDKRHGLINGQLVEVRSIEGERITLADGRILPADYRQFTHGYAVTSHAAQGKTVEDVFLVASSRSLAAINRQQFYVSISRGRQRCRIFTDDRELLRDRLRKSAERTAALELSPLADALKREGFNPKTATKQPAAKKEVSPLAARIPHASRTLRPLHPLRYGHAFVRALQTQIALIVARFTEHLSRARQTATHQRTGSPRQHHSLTP